MSILNFFLIIFITGLCVSGGYIVFMAITEWIPNYQNQNQVHTTPEGLGASAAPKAPAAVSSPTAAVSPAADGSSTADVSEPAQETYTADTYTTQTYARPKESTPILICPKCGSTNISLHTQTEEKKTGCGTILLYILLAITCLGIFILIPLLLRNNQQTVTYAVCKNCGYSWVTSKRK